MLSNAHSFLFSSFVSPSSASARKRVGESPLEGISGYESCF